jgi:predicted O-linked N-acetylglucosamine transferase (SPINDLY family)
MKILKEVPNSYFLLKARGEESIKTFNQVCRRRGSRRDRLRFLPEVALEQGYRANLTLRMWC